jgi:hypothetical protein
MTGHVIDFLPTGEVEAMHNDQFSLAFLGKQEIERATEIKFNPDSQTWGIYLPALWLTVPPPYYAVEHGQGFLTYEEARKVEVQWLNACRIDGVEPASDAGLRVLAFVRSLSASDA